MVNDRQFKIIIVGGGPAGVATGLHLNRIAPHLADQTLIIEAKEYPRDKLCGGGITIHGEEQLEHLGLQNLDVCSFDVHELAFRLGDLEFTVPYRHAMRVIQRAEFDMAIAQSAMREGLCVHTGERLLKIEPVGNGYKLTTNHTEYHTKVVIAADGTNSFVRRKLGFESSESTARLLRVMTPVNPNTNATWQKNLAVFDFSCIRDGVQGYMWDFPAFYNGTPHMNRGIFDSRITPQHNDNQPHGNLKQTFANWLDLRDLDLDDIELKGHPVRWFNPTTEFSRPHILLVGDAAGVDALFAEGISYAMEYGAIAAQIVKEAFERDDFGFTDYRNRVVNHRMGKLLQRRTAVASAIYQHKIPPFWKIFWRMADIAHPRMQQFFASTLALLPGLNHPQSLRD